MPVSESVFTHLSGATGAILCETREERRRVQTIVAELSAAKANNKPLDFELQPVAAPKGVFRDDKGQFLVVNGKPDMSERSLGEIYRWASERPARVLIVYDFHMLINNPAKWRGMIPAPPAHPHPPRPGT